MLGCSRRPSASGMTVMRSPTTVATTEFVVPRSMPMTAGFESAKRSSLCQAGRQLLDGAAAFALHHARAHAALVAFLRPCGGDLARDRFGVGGRADDHEIAGAEMCGEAHAARRV